MEIKAGDYVRARDGKLHLVNFVSRWGLNTKRIHDGSWCVILNEEVVLVKDMSSFPGDSETTRKRAS